MAGRRVCWVCLPGLVLWVVDAMAACLLLGAFCARFRDIPPIVGSLMQIAFFLTPDHLAAGADRQQHQVPVLNPFYPLLAIIRDPLLNNPAGRVDMDLRGRLEAFCSVLRPGWCLRGCAAGMAFWV